MRFAPILALAALAGCQTVPPRTIVVTPTLPAHVLTCPAEPVPGPVVLESDFLDWVEAVRQAGGECRANLDAVRAALPQTPQQLTE